ncbi:MAG: circularly permuted type 2 ATP-grasp protein [Deltaproteobacteria bacterium]|nr:circularly permuted type 2 ATP-grasp protein [Deltaproteobacteria bacterium]
MSASYFDEIRTPDGTIRPHYEGVYKHWQSLRAATKRKLHRESTKLFAGDYPQDPLPRVLTQNEFQTLRRGVEQRAEAIRAFLFDYYSRGEQWKKIIPPTVLRTIIERNHSESVLGKLRPKTIAFPYGPDIIRDSSGRWRIVEDSAGILGGFGDLLTSRRITGRLVPGFRPLLKEANDPKDFFRELASYFQEKAGKADGIALLHLRAFDTEPDHETQRLARIFSSLGIEVSTTAGRTKQLSIEDDGIYLKTSGRKERVRYLVVRSGPEQLDLRTITIDIKDLDSGRNFGNTRTWQGILSALKDGSIKSALLKGHALTNFSPGVHFVNDKMFGRFVDSMIGHFLGQTPILESIPSQPLAVRNKKGRWGLDRAAMRNVIRRKDQFVVKRVDEDGGSGVWIGPKLTRRGFNKAMDVVRAEPERYICQRFEHLSVLEDRIVDLRIHSHVDMEWIIVSNSPWGRANWIDHNGKVNLGSQGFTSPVLVVEDGTTSHEPPRNNSPR